MASKDIFLSYASEDLDRAKLFVSALEQQGWSVWWDRNDIPPGRSFRQVIDEAIEAAKCVLVLWSMNSVKSHWVIEEAEDGRERNILVPALIDRVKIPRGFRSLQAANLIGWKGDPRHREFAKIFATLKAVVPASPTIIETVDPQAPELTRRSTKPAPEPPPGVSSTTRQHEERPQSSREPTREVRAPKNPRAVPATPQSTSVTPSADPRLRPRVPREPSSVLSGSALQTHDKSVNKFKAVPALIAAVSALVVAVVSLYNAGFLPGQSFSTTTTGTEPRARTSSSSKGDREHGLSPGLPAVSTDAVHNGSRSEAEDIANKFIHAHVREDVGGTAGANPQVVRQQGTSLVEIGDIVLAPWDDLGCLYPATVLAAEGSRYTVYFPFDAERVLDRLALRPLIEPSDSPPSVGATVFIQVDIAREQWARGKVVGMRGDLVQVSVDESAARGCSVKTRFLSVSADRLRLEH